VGRPPRWASNKKITGEPGAQAATARFAAEPIGRDSALEQESRE
jgi:hypothetical protein